MATTLLSPTVAPPSAPASWSNILKQPPEQQQQKKDLRTIEQSNLLVGNCNSSKGIAVAVVDANAIIHGGEKLFNTADRFVSIDEVINEIRDPASRHSLNLLPFTVDTLEPSPDSIKKVISFAKATGDLQTLSDVDLKLIALTYMLEIQIHGTQHLRDSPPPIQTVNVKRLPEKDLPGWGDNVPNLAEWEALAHASDNKHNPNSRILPVKDLNLEMSSDIHSIEDGLGQVGSELHSGDGDGGFVKPRRYTQKKKEINLEGKMVADGIDASKGEFGDDVDDWLPAVSRNTHRRFLRRKARRELSEALSQSAEQQEEFCKVETRNPDDTECPDLVVDENYEDMIMGIVGSENTKDQEISASFNNMKLEDFQDGPEQSVPSKEIEPNGLDFIFAAAHEKDSEMMSSQTNEDDDTLHMDELSSEQSWALKSLSESSVACVTSDYAMQNLLLQMGLRLLAPGGMQIRELHRWVLKCHACFKVTTEIGRIFCPACGNGGTLRKVAVTVGENGIILAARRPRVTLRGTKFSIPMPQGGRNAVTKNPILREDQLPQKFIYPKTKKKNKQEQDFFIPDDIFRHHNDKKAPHQSPVRKALAVFSGKRNPNDNHYARPKC